MLSLFSRIDPAPAALEVETAVAGRILRILATPHGGVGADPDAAFDRIARDLRTIDPASLSRSPAGRFLRAVESERVRHDLPVRYRIARLRLLAELLAERDVPGLAPAGSH